MQNTKKRRIKFSNQARIAVGAMVVLGLVVGILAIWDGTTTNTQNQEMTKPEEEMQQIYEITEADKKAYNEDAVLIDLNTAKSQTVITEPGAYILFGETKYAVHVDAQDQIVHLILSGAAIRSASGPAIQVSSAGKVVITLAENTENILRDSGNYNEYAESDAAVYSESDLTINGQGMLSVYGYYKDAIHTKELLKVIDGTVHVQAKRDGLRGNDGIVLMPKEIIVESEGNGIRTTNAKKEGKGTIEILGGEHVITAGKYAIVSEADLYVRDCLIECNSVVANLEIKGKINIQADCIQEAK